jgi:hypothetical protein
LGGDLAATASRIETYIEGNHPPGLACLWFLSDVTAEGRLG